MIEPTIKIILNEFMYYKHGYNGIYLTLIYTNNNIIQ